MSTRTFGEPVKRNEDRRLLTGQALFIDDIELPGMLHVAFLRSQIAHAKIIRIDVSKALQRRGVVAAYVAGDLGNYWQPGPILVPPPPIAGIVFHERTQVPLAKDKVRHVGEPLVIVIAESRYIAEDALDDIALLANATSLGMVGKPPLEISLDRLPENALVGDLIYIPPETPLLAAARMRGNITVNGLGLLLNQARPAFNAWFGVMPEITPALQQAIAATF